MACAAVFLSYTLITLACLVLAAALFLNGQWLFGLLYLIAAIIFGTDMETSANAWRRL